MNRVLLKLYWMTVRAAFRGLGRKLSTVRGAILTIVTLGFFAVMIGQLILMIVIRSRIPFVNSDRSDLLGDLLPLGMLAYFLAAMAPSLGDRAIQFSASEIDFLFPAPFTRRQLLAFYLFRGLIGKLGLAILVAVSISMLVPSILCAIVGIFLALVFLHGAIIAIQLLQQTIGTQLFSRARRIIAIVALATVGFGVVAAMPTGADVWTWLTEFRASTPIRVLTAPFNVFAWIIVAPQILPQALSELAIAFTLITVVYCSIFSLDSRYEDLAVKTSNRMYERIQAIRRGNLYAAASRRTEYSGSFVPRLPWWYGIGPNLRRQLLSGFRDMRGMFGLGLVVAIVSAGVMVFVLRKNPKAIDFSGYFVLGMSAYATFIMSAQLPFGFRSDLNHMEVLKSLPAGPFAIAMAEVTSAAVISCLGQWFLLLAGLIGAPSQSIILLTGAVFYFPFNLLLFGISNLLLLLFPFRLTGGGPDLTLMGRMMIMTVGNLFAVVLGFGIAAVPAGVVFLITANWVTTLVVAWIALLALGLGNLFAVAWAFQRFDVGFDTPD